MAVLPPTEGARLGRDCGADMEIQVAVYVLAPSFPRQTMRTDGGKPTRFTRRDLNP